jgi:hypothetical protein
MKIKIIIMLLMLSYMITSCGESKESKNGFVDKFNSTKQELSNENNTSKQELSNENRPIKGWVAYFTDTFLGNEGRIDKEKAKRLAGMGQMLVLMTGKVPEGKVYFVFDSKGNIATKWLVDYAEYRYVLVYGKVAKENDIDVIFADRIEPSE